MFRDPQYVSSHRTLWDQPRGSVRRASGLVLVGNPEVIADPEQPMRLGGTDKTQLGTLPPHVYSRLVLAQRDEAGVAQVQVGGPFDEFELANERGP